MRINTEEGNKLAFFSGLYENARRKNEDLYLANKRWREQYLGSRQIDPIRPEEGETPMDALVVRNITRELIESQKDMRIPAPKVSPRRHTEQTERNAQTVERLLNVLRDELPFEKMNNEDEYYAPTYGASFFFVEFDASERTHFEVGEGKVTLIDPDDFVPQPGVYHIEDMEYLFVRTRMSRDEIMRKYGVSMEIAEEAEQDPEDGETDAEEDEIVNVVIAFYKNEDDNVCEYLWSGDTEILDIDDYYSRKKYVCKCCGRRKELCEDNPCDQPSYEMQNDEYEELYTDILLPDYAYDSMGTRVQKSIPAMSPVYRNGEPVLETVEDFVTDESGNPVLDMDESGNAFPRTQQVQRQKLAPTRLPYYKPKRLPVVMRRNVPIAKQLYGQSDCEVIRPQQQEINKLESRIHEKLMKSGSAYYKRKDMQETPSDGIFDRVIEIPEGARANECIGAFTCEMSIQQDMAQSERQYEMAKRNVGITDSYVGEKDASAQSGIAKQQQVIQSSGRLESKRTEKYAAYAEIDRILFEYYLAYADEPRPAAYVDAEGQMQMDAFNRYSFLNWDENTGEWYYDDGYTFSVETNGAVEQQRETMWQLNQSDFSSGCLGDPADPQTQLTYWQMQERVHRPNAQIMVEKIRRKIEQMQAMAQAQQNIPESAQSQNNASGTANPSKGTGTPQKA